MNFKWIIAMVIVILAGAWAFTYMQKEYAPSPLAKPVDTRMREPLDPAEITTRTIQLFYYNRPADYAIAEYYPCSADAVLPVERHVPRTLTPLHDSITMLLEGSLAPEEKAAGFTTEFPLSGVILSQASIKGGVATLRFEDPQHLLTGGSCRVALLATSIIKTAQQFDSVKEVHLEPEELFQP